MLQFNVNGIVHNNTDTCKLFNLSAQEIHALDVYIMTDSIAAENWILSTNENGNAKISIEIDRLITDTGVPLEIYGQIFPLKSGTPGESFSNPIIYTRKEKLLENGDTVDDGAHIQKLPTHNAISQESVRMLGGTNNSAVLTEWGKVRATAPLYPVAPEPAPIELSEEEQEKWVADKAFDEWEFYNDRSEWYINMATRDDFLRINLLQDEQTNQSEVDLYMQDIVIIIQPSQHFRLKKNYMYYDIDNEPPRLEPTGVTY